jgi:signal transduction histidine kinase
MAKVLIVDDEKSIRRTLAEFLQAAGYEVETADDARRGFDLLQAGNFDVLVSDIILPGPSGVDLLQMIRKASLRVQVILMTGEPTVETASAAVRSGAFDYLNKPVTKEAILRAVGNAAKIKAIDDERQRLSDSNRDYQQRLEQLVDERTRDLSKALEDLKGAQAHLIRQERLSALGQMASGIAHDFNNALMPISGLSEFLLSHADMLEDKAETIGILETIHSAAQDAAQIVKCLREFYHSSEGLIVTPIKLDKLIGNIRSLTQPRWKTQAEAEGRSIDFETDVRDIPILNANESQIREVLTNLILNAVDAMPKGGTIRIGVARLGEDRIEIRVSDTGEGMPDEVKRHCFEPFYSTKGEKGTGMGLAMVYGIVKRHGGVVDVESDLGKGTTVIICLPRETPGATQATTEEQPAIVTGLRVLAIDDESSSLRIISKYLRDDQHKVELADGGQKGIEKFRTGKYDLVITDRAMPRVGGDHVAEQIKKISPKTPVIMLTGFGDIMKLRKETPKGVDEIVGKPTTQDELRRAIVEVMRRKPEIRGQNPEH